MIPAVVSPSAAFLAPALPLSSRLHGTASPWTARAGGVSSGPRGSALAPLQRRKLTRPVLGLRASTKGENDVELSASTADENTVGEKLQQRPASAGAAVVLQPDFRLALSVFGVGMYLGYVMLWSTLGVMCSMVGAFLVLQTARLRYRFFDRDLDVQRVSGLDDPGRGPDGAPETSAAIGPWDLTKVTHWEFWWPGFPVLAYFKETQTSAEGRRHFLPIIMDGKAMYKEMLEKMGGSTSPKPRMEDWDNLRPLSPEGWSRLLAWGKAKLLEADQRLQLRAKWSEVRAKIEKGEWKELGQQAQDLALRAWAEVKRLGQATLSRIDAVLNTTPSSSTPPR